MKKEKLLVNFSGGQTSAYMSWWLKEKMNHKYELVYCFQNTGCEHEKTLEFINNCDLFFNLNLYWIEAVVNEKGTGYKKVTFDTASRNGEPFEAVIKKYGIPNKQFPHCNRELKIQPEKKFRKDNGINLKAIGIRSDEFERATKKIKENNPTWSVQDILKYRYEEEGIYYPLIYDEPVTKDAIKNWWSKMPFKLEIKEHEGNCITCWKKSDRKLFTLAKENEMYFDFFNDMENKYGNFIPENQKSRIGNQVFFRKYRSANDIIKESKTTSFELFKENKFYQLDLFNCDIDEDFTCNECGTIF